jgi:hypothetical protein
MADYRIHNCPPPVLSWASSRQSVPPHPTSRRSVLILSCRLINVKYMIKSLLTTYVNNAFHSADITKINGTKLWCTGCCPSLGETGENSGNISFTPVVDYVLRCIFCDEPYERPADLHECGICQLPFRWGEKLENGRKYCIYARVNRGCHCTIFHETNNHRTAKFRKTHVSWTNFCKKRLNRISCKNRQTLRRLSL